MISSNRPNSLPPLDDPTPLSPTLQNEPTQRPKSDPLSAVFPARLTLVPRAASCE
jgi:hypothetical protein